MAEHLIKVGADINAQHDVYLAFPLTGRIGSLTMDRYRIISPKGMIAMPNYYYSTPLSHAILSSDWDYVRWLLRHGADPEEGQVNWYHNTRLYGIEKSAEQVRLEYQEILQEVRGNGSGSVLDGSQAANYLT